MVNQWKEVRHELKNINNTVPNVWVSMNSECPHMIKEGSFSGAWGVMLLTF